MPQFLDSTAGQSELLDCFIFFLLICLFVLNLSLKVLVFAIISDIPHFTFIQKLLIGCEPVDGLYSVFTLRAQKILAKNIFFQKWSEMVKNWSNHFLSRIKAQSRGPFWDNLFLFLLLFNLR